MRNLGLWDKRNNTLLHKTYHYYPRVFGSEVLSSAWSLSPLRACSLWPAHRHTTGLRLRVCDGEQHPTAKPSSSRTEQPLSPEADPVVQGEKLGVGSQDSGIIWNGDPEARCYPQIRPDHSTEAGRILCQGKRHMEPA